MISHTIIPNTDLCVYEFNLSNEIDFKDIRNKCIYHIEKYESKFHPGHERIKSTGFFSHAVTDDFNELINLIENKTNDLSTGIIGHSAIKAKWKILETWVMIYKKLGLVNNHSHYKFGLSSVCYVSAENTASIWFHDVEIKTKTGQLLVFPGILKHRVNPVTINHSERIVFAANLYPTLDTSILERNAKHSKETMTNNFYFNHLEPPGNS